MTCESRLAKHKKQSFAMQCECSRLELDDGWNALMSPMDVEICRLTRTRTDSFFFQFPSEDVPATEPIVRHESSFGQLSKANCFDSINFRPNKSLKRNESTMCIKRTLKAKHSSRWFKIASESRFSFCAEFL